MTLGEKLGLGATALGTVAGIAAPLGGWAIGGPIMAVCAAVAVWGFYPLFAKVLDVFPSSFVPLHVAAVRLYEAMEKVGRLGEVCSLKEPVDQRLSRFKEWILADEATEVFGIRPPSRESMQVPKSELDSGELFAGAGETSVLRPVLPLDAEPSYVDVKIRSGDLKRLIANV